MRYLPALGLAILLAVVPITAQAIVCGDVDGNGSKTASDAL